MLVQHHQTAAQKLLDIWDSYQYSQLIGQRTRITQPTSSIVDLFLDSRVANIEIIDHCLVYAIRKICIPKSNPKTIHDASILILTQVQIDAWTIYFVT